MKAGVKGFLSKEAKNTELLKAVEVVLHGGIYGSEQALSNGKQAMTTLSNPLTLYQIKRWIFWLTWSRAKLPKK